MKNTGQKKLFYSIGLLFILSGILLNEWLLTTLFSSDSTIVLSKRILIWSFDVIMIALGAVIIWKRELLSLRKVVLYCIMIVVTVLCIEVLSNIAYYVIYNDEDKELKEKSYLLPQFEDSEWAKGWFQERRDVRIVYKPFKMWGHKEYKGKYINLDKEGYRKNWNPEKVNAGETKTLYMLGGSTTWGYGARDDFTIPSYISKKLNGKGYDFLTYNYGEFAYTNAQEIISLILLLQEGHRPDYVILYDGINDIYAAYQSGEYGALSNQFLLHKRLEKAELTNFGHARAIVVNILDQYSKIYWMLQKIGQAMNPPESNFLEEAHLYSDDELRKLSEEIVDYYSKSYELLDNLSRVYGFKYLCFWQPVVFTEDKITGDEAAMDVRLQDKALDKLYDHAREYIHTKSLPNFYDISDTLHGREKSYYWDWMHITEEGNEVVADRIVSIFEQEYLVND